MKAEYALAVGLVLGAVAMWGVLYVIAVQKKRQLQTQISALQAAEPDNSAIPMLQAMANQPTCACGGVQPS
ncbi:MAG: hypothetical protein JRM85_07910 [Nitrososphaerota archaeon]|jgi:hypothetical protein|nr:hypothetical protein [Nitrososphaerota archaeon]